MTALIALLPQILQLLPLVVTGTQSFITWIEGVRSSAQQSSEWTTDAEAAFVAWLLTLSKAPQWQPDAK